MHSLDLSLPGNCLILSIAKTLTPKEHDSWTTRPNGFMGNVRVDTQLVIHFSHYLPASFNTCYHVNVYPEGRKVSSFVESAFLSNVLQSGVYKSSLRYNNKALTLLTILTRIAIILNSFSLALKSLQNDNNQSITIRGRSFSTIYNC